ncbi:unnamed protein product [Larinioides sclopetarius]|uniref:Uncharacterized protein n=1 Tax=Larinioides sclopetarius TaxID=280406 RepID=A0AAV2BVM5_9ARAC
MPQILKSILKIKLQLKYFYSQWSFLSHLGARETTNGKLLST